jgi:membrane protein DedA with SNARE-associated domain
MTSTILKDFTIFATHNPLLVYAILYLAGIFLGNISAFVGFWLVISGYLGPWGILFLFITLFASDLTGDITWYALGHALRGTRFGTFIRNHLPHHERLERHLEKNSDRWVFLSKFIYASAFTVLFMIGWCRVEFKKFFRAAVLATLVWLPVLLLVAYGLIFALSYLRVAAVFHGLELVFLIGLVIFLAMRYGLSAILEVVFGGNGDGNAETFDSNKNTH